MKIEIKRSINPIKYKNAINILEKKVEKIIKFCKPFPKLNAASNPPGGLALFIL